MKNLPLNGLRVFEAAARAGSFRAAAEVLGLTPSAVSHAVRGLEALLQTTLFQRDARTMALTAQGETLLHHVHEGLEAMQRGVSAVSGRKRMLLRLHSAPSFAAQWLVPRLPRFLAEHGDLEVHVAASTTYTRFQSNEFDADIVYGAEWAESCARARPIRIGILPLGEEEVTPLCAPALASRITTPGALLSEVLIESDNKSQEVRWPAWFAANGVAAPEPRGPRFDRSFLSLSAASDGLGVALESTRLAERELASGRLVRPLLGRCEDVRYVGHWLTFPQAGSYRREFSIFTCWLASELRIGLDMADLPAAK